MSYTVSSVYGCDSESYKCSKTICKIDAHFAELIDEEYIKNSSDYEKFEDVTCKVNQRAHPKQLCAGESPRFYIVNE